MVGNTRSEDLSLRFQSPECPRMNNAAAIALKKIPVGMLRFGVSTPAAAGKRKSQVGEHAPPYLISLITPTAIWLAALVCLISGSNILRASAGLVFARCRASAIAA